MTLLSTPLRSSPVCNGRPSRRYMGHDWSAVPSVDAITTRPAATRHLRLEARRLAEAKGRLSLRVWGPWDEEDQADA